MTSKEKAKQNLQKLINDADEYEFYKRREEMFNDYPNLMAYFNIKK